MALHPKKRTESRLLALSVLFISQNVSLVTGFQTLRRAGIVSLDKFQSPSNRNGKHVVFENPISSDSSSSSSSKEIRQGDISINGQSLSIQPPQTPDLSDAKDEDTEITISSVEEGTTSILQPPLKQLQQKSKSKKLALMWCSEGNCKDAMRERVSGDRNQIILEGPATGQVAYYWTPDESITVTAKQLGEKDDEEEKQKNNKAYTSETSILLLVRPNDKSLVEVAAKVVEELTNETNRIIVYIDSSFAGKLKFAHGIDNHRVKLFEPEGTEGFGGNHVNPDDPLMADFSGLPEDYEPPFDLICTLGGDGLLIHASMLFQGPVPPVISFAGGSLGFLTQFSKEEMADAIRIALGICNKELRDDRALEGPNQNDCEVENDFASTMPPSMHEPLRKRNGQIDVPRFQFGLGERICLSIRMRLDCKIFNREGVLRARFNVLNEVVIDRGSSSYLANLECFCDDVHLTTVQADGIIFAT